MNIIRPNLDGSRLRIGIVQARFTNEIGSKMLEVCCRTLKELGVADENITAATVPGALEVPLVLLQLGNSGEYDALIAIGTIIKGETYHFEVVCNESAAGVSRVSLELGIPVANAILTTYNEEQARQRTAEKGAEAARVAIEMVRLGESLDALHGDDGDDEE